MKYEDLVTLLKAGYTRQEIEAMESQPAPAAPEAAQDTNPTPAPTPAPVPTPTPAPVPAPSAPAADPTTVPSSNPDMASVLAAIQTMGTNIVTALQAAQLGGATLPTAKPDSIESVMASIINPTNGGGQHGK